MKVIVFVAALLLSGCLGLPSSDADQDAVACGTHAQTWYLADGQLVPELPEAGATVGNGFAEGFLNNDLKEWLSPPLVYGQRILGNVSFEYWAKYNGAPAPVVIGGQPGEGYHFFNQFGSNVTFQPSYAIEYGPAVVAPGTVVRYNETFAMPEGGFVVEEGQRVRLLLTGLLLETGLPATDILTGGETPSRIHFTASCFDAHHWDIVQYLQVPVILPGNQGLLTGAVPATDGLNQFTATFRLVDGTERLRIMIRQIQENHPGKDDVDMELLDANGNLVYAEGSPYTNETLVLWTPNFETFAPTGHVYQIKINSYSGIHYAGRVHIVMERSTEHMH